MALELGKSFVRDVTVRSQVTPDLTWDPFAPTPPPAPGGFWPWILREVVRPAVYVHTPAGIVPIEPYGRPTTSYTGAIGLATGAVVLGTIAGIFWLGWSQGKKRRGR